MGKFNENSFIKINDNKFLLKDSNGLYFNKKEKDNIINDDNYLIGLLDITSNCCQKNNIKKVEEKPVEVVENDKAIGHNSIKKAKSVKK